MVFGDQLSQDPNRGKRPGFRQQAKSERDKDSFLQQESRRGLGYLRLFGAFQNLTLTRDATCVVGRARVLELGERGVWASPWAEPLSHRTSLNVPAFWPDSNRNSASVVCWVETCCRPPHFIIIFNLDCRLTGSRGPTSWSHAV